MRFRALAIGAALGAAACATTGPAAPRVNHLPDGSTSMQGEHLKESGARTAWDALRYSGQVRVREGTRSAPARIDSRRGRSTLLLDDQPILVVDGIRITDWGVLRSLRVEAVDSITFRSGSSATLRHGTGAAGGAVEVATRTTSM